MCYTYKLHLIVTFLYISSGMILEASGKIGSDTWLFAGKEKKLFVEKWGMNGKDGTDLTYYSL